MLEFKMITASPSSMSYCLCSYHLKKKATTFQSTLKTHFYKGPCYGAIRFHDFTVAPKHCSSKIKLVYFLIAGIYRHCIVLKITSETA